MPEEFVISQVRGRRICTEDLDDLSEMHADPRVMATLGGIRDRDTTRRYVEANIEHWDRLGFGIYVLRHAADGDLIGRAGLRQVHIDGRDEIEVAYGLRYELWGRGIAAAVTEELVTIATDVGLGPSLVAFTETTNRRSRRVMEKAGFDFEREFEHHGSPHVLYRRALTGRMWSKRGPTPN